MRVASSTAWASTSATTTAAPRISTDPAAPRGDVAVMVEAGDRDRAPLLESLDAWLDVDAFDRFRAFDQQRQLFGYSLTVRCGTVR